MVSILQGTLESSVVPGCPFRIARDNADSEELNGRVLGPVWGAVYASVPSTGLKGIIPEGKPTPGSVTADDIPISAVAWGKLDNHVFLLHQPAFFFIIQFVEVDCLLCSDCMCRGCRFCLLVRRHPEVLVVDIVSHVGRGSSFSHEIDFLADFGCRSAVAPTSSRLTFLIGVLLLVWLGLCDLVMVNIGSEWHFVDRSTAWETYMDGRGSVLNG